MDGSLEPAAALLERAVGYALVAVRPVTPRLLQRPTPCAGWDLDALLRHACDSLGALREGIDTGCVGPPGPASDPADPAVEFRIRAGRLLGAWAATLSPAGGTVTIADLPLTAAAVASAGALEIAVHGWDIAGATGLRQPLPAALAAELLPTAHRLVPAPGHRAPLFGPPLAVPEDAPPGDRLLAFLGRSPDWPAPAH